MVAYLGLCGFSGGACVHCKSLKVRVNVPSSYQRSSANVKLFYYLQVKCRFTAGESRCQRCIAGNHQCTARVRKKRKTAPYVFPHLGYCNTSHSNIRSHDDLREQSRQQDIQIQSLLNQFDKLHMDAKLSQWIQQARQYARLDYNGNRGMPLWVADLRGLSNS